MPLPAMPVLFFPKPQTSPLPKKKPSNISPPQHPTVEQQKRRVGTQFDRLNSAFESQRVNITDSAAGITPEATLVIYTRGSNADFTQACRQVDFELLGEFDEYDLPEDEFFYTETENKKSVITRKPVNKGRLFLTFSDNTAKDKLLSLWRQWCNNEVFERGTGEWKKIFPFIDKIKIWSARERLEEFHMLDHWKERLSDTTDQSPVKFEIELWCHQEQERRNRTLAEAESVIRENGGAVFGQSVTIPEIRFQALKAQLPKETLQQWIDAYENDDNEDAGFFGYREIRFFRPIGQCSVSIETGELDIPVESEDVSGLPLVAILDGHPLAHHRMLNNKLIIDDPDDFDARYEDPREYRHGTAMASLVLHGDLNAQTSLQRPVYLRPVLQPDPKARLFDRIDERIPDDIFPEDLVLRAVRRMFEGDDGESPVAPTVKVINISLGDEEKPFIHTVSSWGRLLDWLSWKYKVLFIVSAGNCYLTPGTQPVNDFRLLSPEEQMALTVKSLNDSTRNRSILTPADSTNSLTIGARHYDAVVENDHPEFIDLLPSTELMSPISSHGPGYRRSLKPEVLFPGGRQLYQETHSNDFEPARQVLRGPGIRTASPGEPGQLNNSGFSCGTSNAAGIASNGAGRIYEMLLELDQSGSYIHDQISDSTIAALIKTLIVHSTFKGKTLPLMEDILEQVIPNRKGKEHVSRFLGYGNADIERVLECINSRGTVIGCSEIQNDTVHEYLLPLPACLHNLKELKRVIITVGWLSPVNHSHHEYRRAALSVITPGMKALKPTIGISAGENDHNQVERGTVIHSVYEGKTAREIADGEYLPVKIKCEDKAGGLDVAIPYGVAVTVEVVENIDIPVYSQIRESIEVLVRSKVQTQAI